MGDVTIGVDLGYGRIKVAGPGFRNSFPAVVAEPLTGSESNGLVEWDGHRYLVGEPALVEPHHRYSARDEKILTPEEMAKFLAALAQASDHYDHRAFSVATGLPPAGYRNAILKQQLVHVMTGDFRFSFEGRVYTIAVPEVTVQPQAGEALFDALLHDDGEIADPTLLEQRTIVVDVGHRTTDVALMSGHRAAMGSRSLLTVEQGVWHVYEEMGRLLSRHHHVTLSPARIDEFWRSGGILKLAGTPTPLAPLVAEAVRPIARSILAEVSRLATDIRLWDTVLLVGGGGHMVQPALAQELGIPVRLVRDPEYANAAGYFKHRLKLR